MIGLELATIAKGATNWNIPFNGNITATQNKINEIVEHVNSIEQLGHFLLTVPTKDDLPATVAAMRLLNPLLSPTPNDFADVQADATKGGASTRYIISEIDSAEGIVWAYNLTIETPNRNFTSQPITSSEIAAAAKTDIVNSANKRGSFAISGNAAQQRFFRLSGIPAYAATGFPNVDIRWYNTSASQATATQTYVQVRLGVAAKLKYITLNGSGVDANTSIDNINANTWNSIVRAFATSAGSDNNILAYIIYSTNVLVLTGSVRCNFSSNMADQTIAGIIEWRVVPYAELAATAGV